MNDPLSTLVVICGPTAIGKTVAAIELARHFKTEILSCDSRQFYKELKIGVARPDESELSAAKHHFIAFLSINDTYNAYRYETDALKCLDTLFRHHKVVIMAGGSGLYIQSLCHGIDELPDPDPGLREALKQEYASGGLQVIRDRLKCLDPDYYGKVDLNNPKRILRALEVTIKTGKSYSSFLINHPIARPFRIVKTGLNTRRTILFDRINRRVDRMIGEGLMEEARRLYPFRHLNALNTVGYKEFFDYFEGKMTYGQSVDKIKTNTRRYAKRQLTWFAKDSEIRWFQPGDEKRIIEYVQKYCRQF